MNDTIAVEEKPAEPQPGNRDRLDRLIFDQNLYEVHLLIDFVSGRADRTLTTLEMPDPTTSEKMTAGAIVKAITQMRYPPRGSDAVNAQTLILDSRVVALEDGVH